MDAPTRHAQEVVYISVDGSSSYYSVMVFYAVLAYPRRHEVTERVKFIKAGLAMLAKQYIAEGGERDAVPPDFRRFKNEKIYGSLRRGFRRVDRRLSAASIAYCLIMDGARIRFNNPLKGGPVGIVINAPNNLTKAVNLLLQDKHVKTQTHFDHVAAFNNTEHRIRAASMPVLHLAIVLFQIVQGSPGKHPETLFQLIYAREWLRSALLHAEKLRSLLPDKISAFVSEETVCLLAAEDISTADGTFHRTLP